MSPTWPSCHTSPEGKAVGVLILVMHLVQNHCIKLASGDAEAVDKDGEGGEVGDGTDEGLHQAERGVPLDSQVPQAGEKL